MSTMRTEEEQEELRAAILACSDFIATVEEDLEYEAGKGPFTQALELAECVVLRSIGDMQLWDEAEKIVTAARTQLHGVRPASVVLAAAILLEGVRVHVRHPPH